MCRPHRWLSGLIPLFLLFIAALALKAPEVRDDVRERTIAAVAPTGLSPKGVSVSGRDVTLSGMSFSADEQARTVATADAVDGVRLVTNDVSLPQEAKPFAFSATRAGDSITLSGSVPDPEARARIVDAAKAVAPKVEDKMAYARGAASDFSGWAKAALAPLAFLRKGSAELVDGALSVVGEARDSAGYQSALQAAHKLPSGLSLAKADISAPVVSPYIWSAIADAGGATLDGFVPSEEVRSALVAAAKAAWPGRAIVDRMQIGAGAGQGFADWARAGLAALGKLASGRASLSDATLTISGEAADQASYAAALAAIKGLPAGLTLGKAELNAPVVAPYVWSAAWDGKTITLEGYAPSEEARAAIVAAAKAAHPGATVVDRMQIARGAPRDFLEAAKAALGALGKLANGKASLSDLQLSLTGVSAGAESLDALAKWVRGALPAGFSAATEFAYPERHPYAVSARKDANGQIVVDGLAPSAPARAAVMEGARTSGAGVAGAIELASGLPASLDYGASTALGLSALGRLKTGEMILSEEGLTIRGVGEEPAVTAVRAALSALPPGVRIRLADLTVLPAAPPPAPVAAPAPPPPAPAAAPKRELTQEEAACQKQLLDRLAQNTIKFRTASADIEQDSEGLIADLAKVLQSCPGVKVEVGGHTDNVGEPDMNKELSLARAKSVVEALGKAGVASDRMSAAGYGDERPIATNDTREGRAQNRRTEFVVK